MSPEPPEVTLVPTSDGSFTLLHGGFKQTYHSVNGALQEARHVFLQEGLIHFLKQTSTNAARVLEVGFGTGLNFLVSAAHCLDKGVSLAYTGIEPFPVDRRILLASNYLQHLPGPANQAAYLHWYPGPQPLSLPGGMIRLELIQRGLPGTGPLPSADVLYFDAFAPLTQPEMWTPEVISHAVSSLGEGGIFVSYSITGHLKRILKELGFRVEKPPGAAGKREMIRAVRSG